MTQYQDEAPVAGRRSRRAADPVAVKVVEVLIVGAGFAGLGAAIRLRAAGITDVAIVERGSEVGGTWRDNQYPGAACD
uniref:FAD-dependent oxidoreductase n=1 Tax=uncultured Nevskia sp. TaxID=228950 RepID=UPI0025E0BFCE